jgi:hypothetical protein
MAAPDYTDLLRWVYDWQTMIAGIVAVVGATGGGVLAYCAGVKQATATRHAADRQIRALQEQNADLKRAEQRRLARESSTVAGMLYAAMGLVARDIGKALAAIPKAISASFRDRLPPDDPPLDAQIANYIRHMVRKYGFDYLRDRVGTFNREDIAVAFMLLEADGSRDRPAAGRARRNPGQPTQGAARTLVQNGHAPTDACDEGVGES